MPEQTKKSFYIRKEENIVKKIDFFNTKESEQIRFITEDEDKPENITLVGQIVFTLLRPSWALKNHIRSRSTITNIMGASSLDPYTFNNVIVEYLLKDWSIENKLKFGKDEQNYDVIENMNEIIGSSIEPFTFDAIIYLYNKYLS